MAQAVAQCFKIHDDLRDLFDLAAKFGCAIAQCIHIPDQLRFEGDVVRRGKRGKPGFEGPAVGGDGRVGSHAVR